MNKEKLSWGLILVFIGTALLLDNLDVINFYWRSVFNMWPVILIIIGVNLLVPRHGIGNMVSIIVTIAALAFLGYRGTFPPHSDWWEFNNRGWQAERRGDDTDKKNNRTRIAASQGTFSHEYDANLTNATLNIKGGAVEYEINGAGDQLFLADTYSALGSHSLDTRKEGDSVTLDFFMNNKDGKDWNLASDENRAQIRLNANPVWRIALDMGAGSADFDLTDYKVASLTFKGGAASFEAKLGMPLEETSIQAESGVASVEIKIPKAAACRIWAKTGLSSRDFPGFTKQEDGSYTTEGYAEATNKFTINLKGGLSSFTVKRYD